MKTGCCLLLPLFTATPGFSRRMLREMTPKEPFSTKTRRNPKGFASLLPPAHRPETHHPAASPENRRSPQLQEHEAAQTEGLPKPTSSCRIPGTWWSRTIPHVDLARGPAAASSAC